MYYLPKFKPGEIIISYRGRVSEQLLLSRSRTNELLFGSIKHSIHRDFPRLTDHFISLIRGIGVTREMLINENTVFPFYKNFLTANRVKSIHNFICDIDRRIGSLKINSNVIHYCPLCVRDDMNMFGETYWRREQNLSSIQTCIIHKCFLNKLEPSRLGEVIFSPNEVTNYSLVPNFCHNSHLNQFENELIEILNGKRGFYRDELISNSIKVGFISIKSDKYFLNKEMLSEFKKYELLITGKNLHTKNNNVIRIFNNNWNGYCPELYVLLSKFVDKKPIAAKNKEISKTIKCINPSCVSFKREITNAAIPYFGDGDVYIKKCPSCGAYYRIVKRNGQDVVIFVFAGTPIIGIVKKSINSGATMKSIRQKYGLSIDAIKKIISGEHYMPDNIKPPDKDSILRNRESWMKLLKSKKFESIKKTGRENQKLYKRLLKVDNEWLLSTNRLFRKRTWKVKSDNFYCDKDLKSLAKLESTLVALIKEMPEIRITASSFSRKNGVNYYENKGIMPLSYQFIKKNSENHFQFKVRRLSNYLLKNGVESLYLKSSIQQQFSIRNRLQFSRVVNVLKSKYGISIKFK